ncbi:type I glyceraldehyde-3-phosphate dehydrogenase [Limnohabitans sp.]|uniref:type I glyceraldehyde-3-phosphate dehydrogenase n=1 Tax=Limnohabitans sp. TaxID=1907725 RepID=UPI0039BC2F58
MTIKLGINGFGRIGRLALRAALKHGFDDIQIVGINDPKPADYLAYMLKYDSVHGRFDGTVDFTENTLIVNGKKIKLSHERDAHRLQWGQMGVHTVLECTGHYLTEPTSQMHIAAGAKKVVISAPSKDTVPMFVYGVNHKQYAGEAIVSNASCTTNCLAPVVKVLQDKWGIKRGLMTTVHAATASQMTVDGSSRKDWRGGRGILENIIPSSTGAAKAVMKAQSEGALQGVLGYTDEKVVSTDFRGESCASVFDATAGIALDKTFVKIVAWYDNEWGYAKQCLEMVRVVNKKK